MATLECRPTSPHPQNLHKGKIFSAAQKKRSAKRRQAEGWLPLRQQLKWFAQMNNKEEYIGNPRRDWLALGVSLVVTLVILFLAPEWVWVGFPFVFTALAGALGRL